jgi:hypothetical protein
MSHLALVEIVERDGQVRQGHPVSAWPLTVGRALDNDIVVSDPHVAAHHLRIEAGDAGLVLHVGESRNGASLGRTRLAAGASLPLPETGEAPTISLGRTRLRLRLPGHALAPELPLVAPARLRRGLPLALAALVVVAGLLFSTWLDADPDQFVRNAAGMGLGAAIFAALWCGGWGLVSRIFTRHAQLGWHIRVFVLASLAYMVAQTLPVWLAFMFDWPWIADFGFVAVYLVAGAALYYHLLAVEPQRPRLMRAVGAVAAVGGIVLALWFNHQRSDRLGSDLYMSHLLPPALRFAKTVPVEDYVAGLAALQAELDRKAKEPPRGGGGGGEADEE